MQFVGWALPTIRSLAALRPRTPASVRKPAHNPPIPRPRRQRPPPPCRPAILRSQLATSSPQSRGGRRYPPYALTEQGAALLSSVLRSERAILVNLAIMRTFVRLRRLLASNGDLRRKLADLEQKYDAQFKVVFDAIRQLMEPPKTKRRRIGFLGENGKA